MENKKSYLEKYGSYKSNMTEVVGFQNLEKVQKITDKISLMLDYSKLF